MTRHPHFRRVLSAIWAPELPSYRRVYAILDGARDSSIYARLESSFQEHCCLYSGELAHELRVTAPYLVQLDADDAMTRDVLNQGWGQSWGVFLRCEESMERLRRHLRHFLIVLSQLGARLIFRYYDPRVLRVFLAHSGAERLAQFFGPVHSFLFEEAEGEAIVEYAVTQGKFCRARASFSSAGGDSEPATLVGTAPPGAAARPAGLLEIEPRLLRAFVQSARVNWIIEHLHEFFSAECRAVGRAGVRSLVEHASQRAEAHGFTTDAEICQYVQIALVLGQHFDQDPELPWARAILEPRPADPDIAIYELHQAAVAHLLGEEQPQEEAAAAEA
jgi:hypothetical protein